MPRIITESLRPPFASGAIIRNENNICMSSDNLHGAICFGGGICINYLALERNGTNETKRFVNGTKRFVNGTKRNETLCERNETERF